MSESTLRPVRALVAGAFVLAIAATVLAGDGLILVPHSHAPGTPAEHPHGLALYRFPIALLSEPTDAPRRASERRSTASFRMTSAASETFVGMSLLLVTGLVALAFAMPRPRVLLAHLPLAIAMARWSTATPTGPPRLLSIV